MHKLNAVLETFCTTHIVNPVYPNSSVSDVLSPCLTQVIFPLVPTVLSLLCPIFLYLISITSGVSPGLTPTKWVAAKIGVSTLSLVLSALQCVLVFWVWAADYGEVTANSILYLFFTIAAMISYGQCIKYGNVSSGFLHLVWLLRLVSLVPLSILIAYAWFENKAGIITGGTVYELLHVFHVLYAFLMVVLLCVADKYSVEYETIGVIKEVNPESHCSAASSLFFWYANSMIRKGLNASKGICTLTYDDLWAMDKIHRADYLRDQFRRYCTSSTSSLLSTYSLFFNLFKCCWRPVTGATLMAIAIVFSRFLDTVFLRAIIVSVTRHDPIWFSMLPVISLFALGFTRKVMTARRDFHSLFSYLSVRSILITALYDKTLKISSAAQSRTSGGQILNMVTTDVSRIRLFWFQIKDYVYCPLLIGLSIAGLFSVIGWNTVYGVVVLVLFLPINFYLARIQSKFEQLQMKYKSERLKLMNDVLSGIRVLKLYAWEPSIRKMVATLRTKELNELRKAFIVEAFTDASFHIAPALAMSLSFLGYTVVQGHYMTPEVAFVSLMFFSMLRFAIYQLPQIVTNTIKALVSGRRIVDFLNEEELQPTRIHRGQHLSLYTNVVSLNNCAFSWDSSKALSPTKHLQNITLNVKKGEFIGVVGRVASGKSSLLSAVLGEMELLDGECNVYTQSIGYVPQQAWIQNRTLRENVTFDNLFNEALYNKTISACALTEDIALLGAGDLTEIGEKGINLSGGQKARVSLARAVYRRADLYILDDVLAAVDSHVANHIFEQVIGPRGVLKHTTRIFALNTLSCLKDCDRIVVMNDGKIHDIGTLAELSHQTEGPFAELMQDFVKRQRSRKQTLAEEDDSNELDDVLNDLVGSPLCESLKRISSEDTAQQLRESFNRQVSQTSALSVGSRGQPQPPTSSQLQEQLQNGRLIDEEELATGIVSRAVYVDYCKAFGPWLFAIYLLLLFGGSTVLDAYSNVWLAKWSSEGATGHNRTLSSNVWNLSIYSGFGIGNTFFLALSGSLLAFGAYRASTKFHDNLVDSLLHSPMSFFDRTPLGRIVNRLSSDIDKIDENVPGCVAFSFILLAEALQNLISIVFVIPILILVIIPLMGVFSVIARIYNLCSVQYRRLSSKSWSVTCSFVQDAYQGAASVRAYNVLEIFRERICKCVDTNVESDLIEVVANRWIQVRLDLLTDFAVFCFLTVAIILGHNGLITVGIIGLVVNSGVMFSGYLGELARVWREVEMQVVCVERIKEYIGNKHEAEWNVKGAGAPARSWPSQGVVVFDNLSLRYREGADLVLKNISFSVSAGEKVGIVGRTGAGKTSLTLALFRIVEPETGAIFIDGINTTLVGLHDLRRALTIIPQDPVLFCGTLRSNLDPFDEYTDDELWAAVSKAHLTEMVSAFEKKLDHEIAEGGNNLSVGQRQLVCLARALLRRHTKILVLDEATAAIDMETDRLLQQSIWENFQNVTILTIAHRLNTIRNYDKVLVLDAGEVREYDSPDNLLADSTTIFSSLARHAGLQESQ